MLAGIRDILIISLRYRCSACCWATDRRSGSTSNMPSSRVQRPGPEAFLIEKFLDNGPPR